MTRAATRVRPRAVTLGIAIAALLSASVGAQVARERWFPRDTVAESVLYVPSGTVLQRLALSYDALLADVYWIRAIQHYGGTRRSQDPNRKFDLLQPLLSITTALDPKFNIAYRFGAIFLSEAPPGGPGRPDQAIALLERGLEARPGNWRYMQDIGFIHYWWRRDYRAAAEWFDRAADQPDGPWWLRSMAAVTVAQGGDRQASRALWQSLAQNADNEWLANNAAWRLQQLQALDDVDALTALVRRFVAAGAAAPLSWDRLVRAGYLRRVPADPAGTPYLLDPGSGRVEVAPDSPLQPLPTEPPPQPAPQ